MKKLLFGALLTLGVIGFVGCAEKATTADGAKNPSAKCGANKSSKCGGDKKEAKKCGAENNGKCGAEK